jgi:hypothetical protein
VSSYAQALRHLSNIGMPAGHSDTPGDAAEAADASPQIESAGR